MAKATGNVRGYRICLLNGYKPWKWKRNNKRRRELRHHDSMGWCDQELSTTTAGMRSNEKVRLKMAVRNGEEYVRADYRKYVDWLC